MKGFIKKTGFLVWGLVLFLWAGSSMATDLELPPEASAQSSLVATGVGPAEGMPAQNLSTARQTATRLKRKAPTRPSPSRRSFAPDRILVQLKTPLPEASIATVSPAPRTGLASFDEKMLRHGVRSITPLFQKSPAASALSDSPGNRPNSPGLDLIHLVQIPEGKDVLAVLEDFRSDPNILHAEPDYLYHGLAIPNDPRFSFQWALNSIRAPQAWDLISSPEAVTVAVVDSGIDYRHEDLTGKVVPGYDYVNSDSDPLDDQGHGTHVAGVIAASSNNGLGIAGVDWNARLMPVKVLDAASVGWGAWLIQGITYAANNGARVINLSVGNDKFSEFVQNAINDAHAKGCLVVAAMGNQDGSVPMYPAAYQNVLAVGAVDNQDQRVTGLNWGSNIGPHIDLVAPGMGILSTLPSNRYESWDGTSMASPQVVGVAALVWSVNPALTHDKVAQIIQESADDQVGNSSEDIQGWDQYYGWGRVDALGAVQLAQGTVTPPEPPGNNSPSFTSNPVTGATEDAAYGYNVFLTDPDPQETLTVSGSYPAWLTLTQQSNTSATLVGTPGNGAVGSHAVQLTVRDSSQVSVSQSFTIVVTNVNDAPTITSTARTSATEDSAYSYNISASDVDRGDSVSISGNHPGWLTLTDNGNGSATLAGTPGNAQVGTHNIILKVTDTAGAFVEQSFTVTVANVNDLPGFTSAPVTSAQQGATYSYSIRASDPDAGDTLSITGTYPTWMSLAGGANGTATLSGTPGPGDVGNFNISLTVRDAANAFAEQSFTITVANVNDPPAFTTTPLTSVSEGAAYSYAVSASDPDAGDTLAITGTVPSWLRLTDNGNGTASLSGTPGSAEIGSHAVTLKVADAAGAFVEQSFAISVDNVNDAPTFTSSPVTTTSGGQPYNYVVGAADPDAGDSLTFSGTYPTWLNLTDNGNGTATLSGTPGNGDSGDYPIELVAADAAGLTAVQTYSLSVASAPVLGGLECPNACLSRVDGGDPASNLDPATGQPRIDVEYAFSLVMNDSSGAPPQQVRLILNGYSYPLELLLGTPATGAYYGLALPLGLVATNLYHFEARDSTGNLIYRLPETGEMTGPTMEMLNGLNMAGVPGDLTQTSLGAVEALGTADAYRWIPAGLTSNVNQGRFVLVDESGPVNAGEGFFVTRGANMSTMPSLDNLPEVAAETFTINLGPGWNLISNPYRGQVRLADTLVERGSDVPVGWEQAAANQWLINSIYYYKGSDWGSAYGFESAGGNPEAILVPGMGYWVYLSRNDVSYRMIIPKPQQ